MTWELYTESGDIIFRLWIGHPDQVPSITVWENIILRPPPWIKPFLPQQGFSTAQVLVTRVRKNLKNPKEPEPMALLYPILQGGTEEELLFPPPYQPLEQPLAPAIPSPRDETRGWGGAARTKYSPSANQVPRGAGRLNCCPPLMSGCPPPPMRQETNLINTGPSLLVTYITGDPRMLSSQTTLET